MALRDITSRSTDGDFIAQVAAALMITATAVYFESGTTPGHTQRAALARQVAQSPYAHATTWALLVAADSNVSAASSPVADQTVLNAVSAAWNLMAGA